VEKGVGKTLREARNRRKIDLPRVEEATKIRIRYLRAIENEEWDVLPGDAYVRAFIRTYASFLGLDGERLAEEHRREVGATRPAERLPRVEPVPLAAKRGRREPRIPPRVLAASVSAVLVAVLIIVGVSSGGGESESGSSGHGHRHGREGGGSAANGQTQVSKPRGLSLRLTATGEVWVCLLDGQGEPVVNGQILEAGVEAGPYRSGSFTVAFGNGAVRMTVNGRQAEIPESSSPVGYSIDSAGALREIPEGERPSCT
jgi:cytoskeleton protein RodZ